MRVILSPCAEGDGNFSKGMKPDEEASEARRHLRMTRKHAKTIQVLGHAALPSSASSSRPSFYLYTDHCVVLALSDKECSVASRNTELRLPLIDPSQ